MCSLGAKTAPTASKNIHATGWFKHLIPKTKNTLMVKSIIKLLELASSPFSSMKIEEIEVYDGIWHNQRRLCANPMYYKLIWESLFSVNQMFFTPGAFTDDFSICVTLTARLVSSITLCLSTGQMPKEQLICVQFCTHLLNCVTFVSPSSSTRDHLHMNLVDFSLPL